MTGRRQTFDAGELRDDNDRNAVSDLPPLTGLVVADCSDGIAGQFTGRMFAAYGAHVTLVEDPGGTATRSMPPYKTTSTGAAWSLLFEHLNAAKDSVERVEDPVVAGAVGTLLADADVVIRDRDLPWLSDLAPTTVECVLSDFPSQGAYARWRSTEMIQQALCGTMYQTGDSNRFPLYGAGHRSDYAAGTTAFVSTLVALWERRSSGLGQRAETSTFEALAAMAENTVTLYGYSRTQPPRRPSDLLGTIRCADGWIVLYALTGWADLCEIFDAPEMASDPRFERSRDRVDNWAVAVDGLSRHAADLSAHDIVARCQERKIICEHVTPIDALVESEQWRGRGMVVVHADPPEGVTAPPVTHGLGPMFRLDAGGYVTAPAPRLGGPSARTLTARGTRAPVARPGVSSADATARSTRGSGRLPLEGIRVVDLTTAWSGPMATRGLSWFGAEVVKVEPPTRLDAWRGMYLGRTAPVFPDFDGGDRRYDRCSSFNTQGHDKRSFGLDVKAPGGHATMLDLIASADVLIANYSAGVLDRLGFGYAEVTKLDPRLIVVEMPAFGPGGPLARHVAMGSTMEAACGMGGLIGYGDGKPWLTGSTILDPIGGLNATAAVLVALHQREVTGRGCHVEVAQTEAASHWIGELVLAELEGVTRPSAEGNIVDYAEPHDAFGCQGRDEWVAIAVVDETAWRGLCATIGHPELAEDPRFADATARRANRRDLADVIAAWTARRTKLDAAAKLQAAGVPAAPVNRGVDVFFDPALRGAGFIVTEEHPAAGVSDYPGLAYHLSRSPGAIRDPAPLFGADNRFVLTEILAYGAAEIAELYETRTVCDEPYDPRRSPAPR